MYTVNIYGLCLAVDDTGSVFIRVYTSFNSDIVAFFILSGVLLMVEDALLLLSDRAVKAGLIYFVLDLL